MGPYRSCHTSVQVGTWNSLDKLNLGRVEKEVASDAEFHPLANKTFVICAVLVRPSDVFILN